MCHVEMLRQQINKKLQRSYLNWQGHWTNCYLDHRECSTGVLVSTEETTVSGSAPSFALHSGPPEATPQS